MTLENWPETNEQSNVSPDLASKIADIIWFEDGYFSLEKIVDWVVAVFKDWEVNSFFDEKWNNLIDVSWIRDSLWDSFDELLSSLWLVEVEDEEWRRKIYEIFWQSEWNMIKWREIPQSSEKNFKNWMDIDTVKILTDLQTAIDNSDSLQEDFDTTVFAKLIDRGVLTIWQVEWSRDSWIIDQEFFDRLMKVVSSWPYLLEQILWETDIIEPQTDTDINNYVEKWYIDKELWEDLKWALVDLKTLESDKEKEFNTAVWEFRRGISDLSTSIS